MGVWTFGTGFELFCLIIISCVVAPPCLPFWICGRIPGGAAVADRSAGIQEIVEKPLGRAGRAALAGIPEIDLCCVVAGKALVPQAWISRIVEYRDLIGSGADLRAGGGAGANISLRTSLRLGATTLSVRASATADGMAVPSRSYCDLAAGSICPH